MKFGGHTLLGDENKVDKMFTRRTTFPTKSDTLKIENRQEISIRKLQQNVF